MKIANYNEHNFIIQDDDIWATQGQLGKLYGVAEHTVNYHLKNIFESNELDKNSVYREIRYTATDGKNYNAKHYNLDVIIAVGYRINSKSATTFRKWATQVLNQYLKDGYIINEQILSQNPDKLDRLAAEIRRLRASEKSVFAKVRECFKIASSDYEPSSAEVKQFYALLQDKFHHAVTKMTASQLIMDRADGTLENMGVLSFDGVVPSKKEANIGKNYLTQNELYRMYLLSEQFLNFAESIALANKQLTMKQLHQKLDDMLVLNEMPVFDGYTDRLKNLATSHIEREYKRFINIQKLKMLGIEVDLESYDLGEYDDYKETLDNIALGQLRVFLLEKSA